MPKLWSHTVATHRQSVRDATLNATAALVAEHGLTSVTMSQIAERTGIGRATLYKYFPDIDAILVAWHERHIANHLRQLDAIREGVNDPRKRLEAVLLAYALIAFEHPTGELVTLLHRGQHLAQAQHRLNDFIRDLIVQCAKAGELRSDVAPDELTRYCLHALTAAGDLPSKAGVRRLVKVTMAGLLRGK